MENKARRHRNKERKTNNPSKSRTCWELFRREIDKVGVTDVVFFGQNQTKPFFAFFGKFVHEMSMNLSKKSTTRANRTTEEKRKEEKFTLSVVIAIVMGGANTKKPEKEDYEVWIRHQGPFVPYSCRLDVIGTTKDVGVAR